MSIATSTKQRTFKPSEIDIQNTIRDYLRALGWYVIRHHQTLGSHPGLADLSAVGPGGQVLWIEVKRPGMKSKQSDAQIIFQQEIEARGGRYVLARSVEDVAREVKARGAAGAVRAELI